MTPALPHIPVLETERLILRAPRSEDFSPFAAYCASDRTRFVGGPKPAYAAFEKLCAMIGHWALRGFGRFVITRKDDDAVLGHVGPLQLDETRDPDMTWTLWDAAHEGRGYAHEATSAVMRWMPDATGLTTARVEIHPDNLASIRLARRLGALLVPGEIGWGPDWQIWTLPLAQDHPKVPA